MHTLIDRVHSLPPIIVCRFILNLRQVKHAGSSWVSGDQSHSLKFVGNMGQSLQFGEDQEEDDRLGGDEHTTEFGDLPEAGAEPQNLNLVQVNEDADGNRQCPDLDVQEVRFAPSTVSLAGAMFFVIVHESIQ